MAVTVIFGESVELLCVAVPCQVASRHDARVNGEGDRRQRLFCLVRFTLVRETETWHLRAPWLRISCACREDVTVSSTSASPPLVFVFVSYLEITERGTRRFY